MPDKEVKTLRDVVLFQYAKLVTRSAFGHADGAAAKKADYGFIRKTFRDLRDGKKQWSDITREDWQFVDAEKACAYCGATEQLSREHIVPRSLKINERCGNCDTIQAIHNQVLACRACNSKKGTMGLYAFYKRLRPDTPKFFDFLPALLEKKYLKTVYDCLVCAGCLEQTDADGDGQMTVLDIDFTMSKCN
jgi:5-methylcytosine-specific restriction endonuclease McrA